MVERLYRLSMAPQACCRAFFFKIKINKIKAFCYLMELSVSLLGIHNHLDALFGHALNKP